MKKLYTYAFALAVGCLLVAGAVMAQGMGSGQEQQQQQEPAGISIGQKIGDFTLTDTEGKKHSLASLRGEKGIVLIFVSVQCPVSNAYNERMEKLAQDYRARGINVVGINANSTESTDDVKHHAAEHHLTFTILKDKDNKIADLLGAQHTPEAYLLDTGNKLLYHGRIDNSRNEQGVSSKDLRDAIDATLAGQPVKNAYVRAFGCSIKRAS
jgi:peroxiredoxin